MSKRIIAALLAGSLLTTSFALASGQTLAEQKAARHAGTTMSKAPARAHTVATPAAARILTADELAQKAADRLAGADRHRFDELMSRLQNGQSIGVSDKAFIEAYTSGLSHKGGDHQVDEGGPDAFGNTWIMTGDDGGPEYSWVDIPEEDRTYVTLTDDSFAGPFDLGSAISFYGEAYSSIYVGSNGMLGFSDVGMNSLGNGALPDGFTPNALLAFFWDDLNPGSGGTVYYGAVDGDWVLSFDAVSEFGGTGTITAQVVIDFDGSAVYYNYASLAGGVDVNGCTIGIENADGSDGLQVVLNGSPFPPADETTIRIDLAPPADYSAAFVPTTGNMSVGSPGQTSQIFSIINTGLMAHSLDLSGSMDQLDLTLMDAAGENEISTTPVLDPLDSFDFMVVIDAVEGLGQMVDTGSVVAVSSGDESEFVLPLAVSVVSTHGGPDMFGNTWAMTGDADGTPYFWVDLPEEDRTIVTLGDDTSAGPFDMGGVLSFYGTARSSVYIGSNGFIGFLPDWMTSLGNTDLPNPQDFSPNSLIALFWDDLNPGTGGQVYYGTDDQDRFVITFDAVSEYFDPGSFTAQVVMDFETQQIFLNYESFDNGIILNECTVGIEDDLGTDGLQVLFDGQPFVPTAQNTIRFDLAPPPEYSVFLPTSLEILGAANGTFDRALTVTNTGALAETYNLSLDDAGAVFDWDIVDVDGNPITSVGPIPSLASEDIFVRMIIGDDPQVLDDFVTVTATCSHDNQRFDTTDVHGIAVPSAGSDSWGNSWISSLDEGGPESTWIDLDEADRTYVDFPGGPDSFSGPFEMPSPLTFYGGSYSDFYVSAKAFMGFIPDGMATWFNTPIPSDAAPNAQIYVFWDDMNPVADSGGSVYYGTDEEGRLVLTWDHLRQYFDGPGWVTVQAVVDPANNQVLLNYQDFSPDMPLTSCTVGIENEDGTVALQVLSDADPFTPSPGLTLQFDLAPPPDFWFGMDNFVQTMGSANESVTGTLTLYNTGLSADSYQLSVVNSDGYDVQTEINGTPASVTPTIQPGGSIDIDIVVDIPEIPVAANTFCTLTATSNGNGNLSNSGQMATQIVLVQGGPDGGGYFWSTTDADGSVEYAWETMNNPVTVPLSDDNYAGPFDMGMTWTHYGSEYTQIYIASNGYIGFNETSMGSLSGQDMPSTVAPNGVIAGFWDDLNPGAGGTVSYSVENDMFIVQYDNVPEFGGNGTVTYQIILDANEEAVRVNYQNLTVNMDWFTIGQENESGTQGFSASYLGDGWMPTANSSIWFGFNVIGPSGPYAVRINPDEAQGVGINGGYAEYEFEVENRGENDSSFDLSVSGNIWDVTWHDIDDDWAEITQIPSLVYDEIFNLGVRVHVPAEPESYTDQALVHVSATGHPDAFSETEILTAASCNHMDQMVGNVTGTGLFGMDHLSDGEYVNPTTLIFMASGVNRMVQLNMSNSTVGTISVLPIGHDYSGIAYDDRDGTYWVSYMGGISHVSANGTLITNFTPALLAANTGRMPTGLAFDSDNNILWAICSHGGADDFVRMDVSDAANLVGLNAVTVPWSAPFGSGAAGLDYHEETDQLVAIHTVSGTSECFLDLGNGSVDARGDFCPSGLAEGHGVALTPDGDLYVGWTSGLAHPVDRYRAPCDFGVGVVGGNPLPVAYELGSNYPNPFNPSTTLRYALPATGRVTLEVYNLLGQHQVTLVDGIRPAGYHEVRFDAGNLASGVYFYRVTVMDNAGHTQFSDVQKMMLMK